MPHFINAFFVYANKMQTLDLRINLLLQTVCLQTSNLLNCPLPQWMWNTNNALFMARRCIHEIDIKRCLFLSCATHLRSLNTNGCCLQQFDLLCMPIRGASAWQNLKICICEAKDFYQHAHSQSVFDWNSKSSTSSKLLSNDNLWPCSDCLIGPNKLSSWSSSTD